MKKMIIGSTMTATFCALIILMSSFFTSLFTNLGTAIEKTMNTGNPQYISQVGENSWKDLCATVNSMPLMSSIKKMMVKEGADSNLINQVTGKKHITTINKPNTETVNKIAKTIGTDKISQKEINKIYNTKILSDKDYEKIAEETDTKYDEFFDNLFKDE